MLNHKGPVQLQPQHAKQLACLLSVAPNCLTQSAVRGCSLRPEHAERATPNSLSQSACPSAPRHPLMHACQRLPAQRGPLASQSRCQARKQHRY